MRKQLQIYEQTDACRKLHATLRIPLFVPQVRAATHHAHQAVLSVWRR